MDDQELRRWAIDAAIRSNVTAYEIPKLAKAIAEYVIGPLPPPPAARGPVNMWGTEERRAFIVANAHAMGVAELTKAVNALPGPTVRPPSIRIWLHRNKLSCRPASPEVAARAERMRAARNGGRG